LQPDILFVDVDDASSGSIELLEIGSYQGIAFGVTASKESNYLLSLLDKGFFDVIPIQDFSFELFCKKINKMMKYLYYLNKNGSSSNVQLCEPTVVYTGYPPTETALNDGMFVRYNKISIKVRFDEILYVKNIGNVLKLYLINNKIAYHNSTLRKFIKNLPANQFIRINNSTIVNHTQVESFARNTVSISGHSFPVTKSYLDNLKIVLKI
ncbi:LytTR family transcriptional regulator, partial [Bacteroidales bacterium OttesenSCG-928-C03]|nr:LytTR family transcriptional regulator [Bacteroidales bacterium OttesenSCG-928-C03]